MNLTEYRNVIDNINEVVFKLSPSGTLQFINQEWPKISGHALDASLNQKLIDFIDPSFREEIAQAITTLNNDTDYRYHGEVKLLDNNGISIWVTLQLRSATANHPDTNASYLFITGNINSHKATEERNQFLATHDFLTSLPNRYLFTERLQHAIDMSQQTKQQHAVLFMDLDDFKAINDSLGHQTGDRLLQQLAVRLLSIIKQSDTVARIGGDEFTILLEHIDHVNHISEVSKRIIGSFEQPFEIDGNQLKITTSIGVALYPNDHDDVNDLIRCAGAAMYHAKECGKNNVQFFTSEIHQRIERRFMLDRDMRDAIENNQFELYYQPQIDAQQGEITGVEALIRWQHPEKGLLMPADFIPFAEESDLITELGNWVLTTACKQAPQWSQVSPTELTVSVNVSVRQLMHSEFIDSVTSIVKETQVNPNFITLELTESIMLRQPELAISLLNQLKEMGFKLSIDDFGTGYSSLQYLRLLPLDQLKIDQSFVHAIRSKEGLAIINTICALGHSMGLSLLAEGVEDADILPLLQELGCRHVQGFLYSYPLNLVDANRFLGFDN